MNSTHQGLALSSASATPPSGHESRPDVFSPPSPANYPRRTFLLTAFFLGVIPALHAGLLCSEDFNADAPVPAKSWGSAPSTVRRAALGSIDRYLGEPSGAVELMCDLSPSATSAGMVLGPFQTHAPQETDLAKLTVSFDLWTDMTQPIRAVLTSLDAAGQPTGTRIGTISPPVRGAWYRFSLDLDRTQPGTGQFDPQAPQLEIRFELNHPGDAAAHPSGRILRIDNLSYTSPAYYVSPTGDDRRDGRTATTAFATIQHAIDAAKPGDVILLMNGTYTNTTKPDISQVPKATVNAPVWRPWWVATTGGICRFAQAGTPAAWIVLRSHPGHHPRLFNRDGWEAVKIDLDAAYIEVRELTLQGNSAELNLADALADSDITERGGWRYYGDARFNNNGIMVDGRATPDPSRRPHHLRFIGNTVFDFPAAGIVAMGADHVTTAGNTIYENVHFTRWGASGISYLNASNFDRSAEYKMFVLGNRSYLNRCYVPWVRYQSDAQGNPIPNDKAARSTLSDGNGIIIDVNLARAKPSDGNGTVDYLGRTLVANNLSYGNGGGGITITTCRGVDIVNNTVFNNIQSPELAARGWADIFVGGPQPGSTDVRLFNNIVVARHASKSFYAHSSNQITAENNLFHGAPAMGADLSDRNNTSADPQFVQASLDPVFADFHLAPGSPARAAGAGSSLVPPLDLDGRPRPALPSPPDMGAYQH